MKRQAQCLTTGSFLFSRNTTRTEKRSQSSAYAFVSEHLELVGNRVVTRRVVSEGLGLLDFKCDQTLRTAVLQASVVKGNASSTKHLLHGV